MKVNLDTPVIYRFDIKKSLEPSLALQDETPFDDTDNNTVISLPLSFMSLRLPRFLGWYMLEATVLADAQLIAASISFGSGRANPSGVNPQRFLLRNGKTQKRIVLLRKNIRTIAIDLDTKDSNIEFKRLKLVKITSSFAIKRIKRKLGLEKSSNIPLSKLWRQYCNLFNNNYSSVFLANLEPSYQNWIKVIEKPNLPSKTVIENTLASLTEQPLISIILPTYNTPVEYLSACINSVKHQHYKHWELCIADDASTSIETKNLIRAEAASDNRIKAVFKRKNGHISEASNDALRLASGDYVAFLDHDDMLSTYALYYVALAINERLDAKIIYSDEDWIDKDGRRITPHFKSDWNPDLFFSHNYITHLAVYKHDLLKAVEGLRLGVEGSQDYDLILRCLPHISSEMILHIPRILYHWRAIEGSTALSSDEKSYTVEAGRKSLNDYFKQTNQEKVSVSASEIDNTYRVIWPIPSPSPSVTLLIPTRDMKKVLETAITSLLNKTNYPNFEILIIDNGSSDSATLDYLRQIVLIDSRVRVLKYNKPFNYSAINNFGAANSRSDILGLVNNDIEVINNNWLTEMVSHAVRPDIGCVGAKLYYSNDTIQHAGIIMGLGGAAAHSHRYFPKEHPGYIGRLKMVQNLSGVTAACLLVKRSVYTQVNGLDEDNLKVAYNDVDFCLKVREAGYRNLWTPFAELYHYESLSRGYEESPEKITRFKKETKFLQKKWGNKLKQDPYYNPNLTHSREDFSLNLEKRNY